MKPAKVHYNGGRRSGIDRRIFSYAVHIPEMRSRKDRRTNGDRRSGGERRITQRLTRDRRKHVLIWAGFYPRFKMVKTEAAQPFRNAAMGT